MIKSRTDHETRTQQQQQQQQRLTLKLFPLAMKLSISEADGCAVISERAANEKPQTKQIIK